MLDELVLTIKAAREDRSHMAVIRSVELIAKLKGMLTERIEVGGPGSFSACGTVDQVARQILAEMDISEALRVSDEMRQAIEREAAMAARPAN